MKEQHIPVHNNDILLILGDICWFVWNIYGLYVGVPIVWGCISLVANTFSIFLLISKYYDNNWTLTQEVT